MDAAASRSRLGWVVGLLGLSVLLNYIDRGAIGIAAPLLKQELNLSASQFGLAASAFAWVYAPLCAVAGILCDRFSVYRMLALGIVVWALATLLTGWVTGLGVLIALRLLLGLGESIAFPGSSKIIAAQVAADKRGMANAVIAAALAFGPAVGTLAGGAILANWGWRPVFWIFGAITLLWLLPWHIASAPLRASHRQVPQDKSVSLGSLCKVPELWLMGIAHIFTSYGFYFLLTWLPLYLTTARGYSIEQMFELATLGYVAQGSAALLSGWLSDRASVAGGSEIVHRRRAMIWGQGMSGLAIAALWFAQGPWQVGACLVVAGIGAGVLATNIYATAQIFAGPRAAGSWIGLQNGIGNISGIVGPILTGIIVDKYANYGLAFAIAAGLSLLGAFWWWKVMPEIRPATIA